MSTLSNQDFLAGLHAAAKTLAALKRAMQDGQRLTDLQQQEAVATLDLIRRQVEFNLEDFTQDKLPEDKKREKIIVGGKLRPC